MPGGRTRGRKTYTARTWRKHQVNPKFPIGRNASAGVKVMPVDKPLLVYLNGLEGPNHSSLLAVFFLP